MEHILKLKYAYFLESTTKYWVDCLEPMVRIQQCLINIKN